MFFTSTLVASRNQSRRKNREHDTVRKESVVECVHVVFNLRNNRHIRCTWQRIIIKTWRILAFTNGLCWRQNEATGDRWWESVVRISGGYQWWEFCCCWSVNCGRSREILSKIIKISKNKFMGVFFGKKIVDLQELKLVHSKTMDKCPE
jgi:hypothetical protein